MANVKVDIDIMRPSALISQAVEEGAVAAAHMVKKRSDRKVHVGTVRRNVATTGKNRGKPWTSRRPGRLKKTGRAYKSRFKGGGAIVMYGSFMGYYGFMHHWGVKNRFGKEIKENKFLTDSVKEASGEINRFIASKIKDKLK